MPLRRRAHAQSYCELGQSRDKAKAALHAGCYGAEAPLKLGMNVISKMHLYFATKESMLYFTAADAGHEGAAGQGELQKDGIVTHRNRLNNRSAPP